MFARSVSIHLKPNRVEEFTRIIEKGAIPVLLLALLWPTPAGYFLRLGVAAWVAANWAFQAGHGKYARQVTPSSPPSRVAFEN